MVFKLLFQQYFSNIVAVSFIGGRSRNDQRKAHVISHIWYYQDVWSFHSRELSPFVICPDLCYVLDVSLINVRNGIRRVFVVHIICDCCMGTCVVSCYITTHQPATSH